MQPFVQGISLLHANDADNAYKSFKNSLKQTSHKLYLDPIMNFYYGAALRLCKSEMAKKTLNAFMNGKEGYLYESHAAIKAFRESLSENKYNINNISIIHCITFYTNIFVRSHIFNTKNLVFTTMRALNHPFILC